jgi:CBS domain-containing protein
MQTIQAVYRSAVGVSISTSIRDAAIVMEHAGVGCLGVLDGERLVGIVTDRDIVRRSVARGVDTDARIDSIMTTPVVSVPDDADLSVAFAAFGRNGLRRLPVVAGERLLGIITLDDLLIRVTGQLDELVRPITAEIMFAHRDAAVPAVA